MRREGDLTDIRGLDVRGRTLGFNPKRLNLDVRGFWTFRVWTFGVGHLRLDVRGFRTFGRKTWNDLKTQNPERPKRGPQCPNPEFPKITPSKPGYKEIKNYDPSCQVQNCLNSNMSQLIIFEVGRFSISMENHTKAIFPESPRLKDIINHIY